MAGFKTHLSTSTIVGVGYASAGYFAMEMPAPACVLAGCLCSVSGMMPDLDSDSGVPIRESMAFAAAVVPMLMIDRFRQMGLPVETMVLLGAMIYLLIRFAGSALLKKFTVHRGMWHSIPAVMISFLIAFILCSGASPETRLFKAAAVALGYLTHLLLDELYSIEWKPGRIHYKKSFGTAMKFWGGRTWGNISVYGKLAFLAVVAVGDPIMMDNLNFRNPQFQQIVNETITWVSQTLHV